MNQCFDDVLLLPKFSTVNSRKDVDVSTTLAGKKLALPIISSNMDSVTGVAMVKAMHENGGLGCLHRFWSIEDNVKAFLETNKLAAVSVGAGKKELERFEALYDAGCDYIFLDLAHGASMVAVDQVKEMRKLKGSNFKLVVGNFATYEGINNFLDRDIEVDAFKVGIGGGSSCLTRVVTGVGVPTLGSIRDCVSSGYDIIADGSIRNSGDFAKALAAGAKAVMCGKLLAGATESPGDVVYESYPNDPVPEEEHFPRKMLANGTMVLNKEYKSDAKLFKKYRGSASAESYEVQNKTADHRTPEGDAFLVPYVGDVKGVLQQLEAGLRSSMSYLGAHNLDQFRENAEFLTVSGNALKESQAHGKL